MHREVRFIKVHDALKVRSLAMHILGYGAVFVDAHFPSRSENPEDFPWELYTEITKNPRFDSFKEAIKDLVEMTDKIVYTDDEIVEQERKLADEANLADARQWYQNLSPEDKARVDLLAIYSGPTA